MKETAEYRGFSSSKLIGLLQQKDERIEDLQFRLNNLERAMFGKSSERFPLRAPIINQSSLFEDEPVVELPPLVKTSVKPYDREKAVKDKENHNGRNAFPKHIERVEVIIEPEGVDLSEYKYIGEEVSEKIDYVPGRMVIRRTVRKKYVRITADGQPEFIIGEMPSSPIEKGIPTAMLLAWIMVEKFVYHIPFHRTIQKFKHLGIDIKPSTVSGWMRQCCQLLVLLYDKLLEKVLAQDYLMVDETVCLEATW